MLNPVVSRRQIGGLEDTKGPPVTGGDYCVVVSSLVLPFSWTGVKIKIRDYVSITVTVTFMYVITRTCTPFHCDLDNLDIVDGVHSSSREHMFNLSPLSPTTVYFILQQDKKKAKAEGK